MAFSFDSLRLNQTQLHQLSGRYALMLTRPTTKHRKQNVSSKRVLLAARATGISTTARVVHRIATIACGSILVACAIAGLVIVAAFLLPWWLITDSTATTPRFASPLLVGDHAKQRIGASSNRGLAA